MAQTELGNTIQKYGRNYNISVTNLSGDNILNSSPLVENTLVVSSPIDSQFLTDLGTYSLFMTDNNGEPVRLTYTIKPGNGLTVNSINSDVLEMSIDNDTINSQDDTLFVNKSNLIDNNTLTVSSYNRIKVVTQNLDKATNLKVGVVKSDNKTTNISNGIVSVVTRNLNYVDDATYTPGIVLNQNINAYQDTRTIQAKNGILSVLTENLDTCTPTTYGITKPDNLTLTSTYGGELSVLTYNLDKAGFHTYGVVSVDYRTIRSSYGELSVQTQYLEKTSTSRYGVIKIDDESLEVKSTGVVAVKDYAAIQTSISTLTKEIADIYDKILEIQNRVAVLETTTITDIIYSFVTSGALITELSQPIWNKETKEIIVNNQEVSVVFSINTNCKFKVNVEFIDNVAPAVTLQTVRLGVSETVSADGLTNQIFESTDSDESTLKFTFTAANYTASTNELTTSTKMIVTVTSVNDASVNKQVMHTFIRYNNSKFVQGEEPVTTTPEPWAPVTTKAPSFEQLTPKEYTVVDDDYIFEIKGQENYKTAIPVNIKLMSVEGKYMDMEEEETDIMYENYINNKLVSNTDEYVKPSIQNYYTNNRYANTWYLTNTPITQDVTTYITFSPSGYPNVKARIKFIQTCLESQPSLNVTATLSDSPSSYCMVTIDRNEKSRINGNNWIVETKFNWKTNSGIECDYAGNQTNTESTIKAVIPSTLTSITFPHYFVYNSSSTYTYTFSQQGAQITLSSHSTNSIDKIKRPYRNYVNGMVIKDVIPNNFQYPGGPMIEYNVNNCWKAVSIPDTYSFGNSWAYHIWFGAFTDSVLQINVKIHPGTGCTIPHGHKLRSAMVANNGKDCYHCNVNWNSATDYHSMTFEFKTADCNDAGHVLKNKHTDTWSWNTFYDDITVECTPWDVNTGTTVTFWLKANSNHKHAKNGNWYGGNYITTHKAQACGWLHYIGFYKIKFAITGDNVVKPFSTWWSDWVSLYNNEPQLTGSTLTNFLNSNDPGAILNPINSRIGNTSFKCGSSHGHYITLGNRNV